MPCQAHYRPSVFNAQEELIVQQEIKTLLGKGVKPIYKYYKLKLM